MTFRTQDFSDEVYHEYPRQALRRGGRRAVGGRGIHAVLSVRPGDAPPSEAPSKEIDNGKHSHLGEEGPLTGSADESGNLASRFKAHAGAASRLIAEVDPADGMLRRGNLGSYLRVGGSALSAIKEALKAAAKPMEEVTSAI